LPRPRIKMSFGGMVSEYSYRPLGAGFGYSSSDKPKALLAAWGEANAALAPHLRSQIVCVLGSGCLTYLGKDGNYDLSAASQSTPIWVEALDDSLMLFYLALMSWFSHVPALRVPDLMTYAGGPLPRSYVWYRWEPEE